MKLVNSLSDGYVSLRIDFFLPQVWESLFHQDLCGVYPVGWGLHYTPSGKEVFTIKNSFEAADKLLGDRWYCRYEEGDPAYVRLDYKRGVRFVYDRETFRLTISAKYYKFSVAHNRLIGM